MKTALEEIVTGQHNDEGCKEFQERHKEKYGVAPPQCKFKEHPGDILKLIEKIDFNKAMALKWVSKLKTTVEDIENVVDSQPKKYEETLKAIFYLLYSNP